MMIFDRRSTSQTAEKVTFAPSPNVVDEATNNSPFPFTVERSRKHTVDFKSHFVSSDVSTKLTCPYDRSSVHMYTVYAPTNGSGHIHTINNFKR